MERDRKEQNGMKTERQNREQKQNAAEQTYGTEMIITDRNVLLGNVMSEQGTVTLLSIIILNECIIEFSQYHVSYWQSVELSLQSLYSDQFEKITKR